MKIKVNDEPQQLAERATVTAIVSLRTGRELLPSGQPADGGRLGIAVVRNGELVPRSQWAQTALAEGDDVEIVTAVQGG